MNEPLAGPLDEKALKAAYDEAERHAEVITLEGLECAIRAYLANSTSSAAPAEAVKRWPFVETPVQFADRLAEAMTWAPSLLSALRHVLIENPAAIAPSTPDAAPVVRGLEWKEDHGVAGLGPYRLFEAETPVGKFSYGTDSEGSCWWCGQYIGIFTVGDEAAAKRQAEAAWEKTATAEASKFLSSPALIHPIADTAALDALREALLAIAAGCHRAKWSYEELAAPAGTPSVFDFLHNLGDQAKNAAFSPAEGKEQRHG